MSELEVCIIFSVYFLTLFVNTNSAACLRRLPTRKMILLGLTSAGFSLIILGLLDQISLTITGYLIGSIIFKMTQAMGNSCILLSTRNLIRILYHEDSDVLQSMLRASFGAGEI